MRFSFVVGCSWALLSCGDRTCTELGCPTPIAITVLESERWTADDYEIRVTTDGFDERCRLERGASNEGGGGSTSSGAWSCTRTPKHFEVTLDEEGRVVVLVFERVDDLDIVIEESGSDWLSEELDLVYRITTPNGQGCGECARADVDVEP